MQLFSADTTMFLIPFFVTTKTLKASLKRAHNWPKCFFFSNANQPKSQFLFQKNLPPRDFSIMTLMIGRGRDLCRLHWDFTQKSEEHGHNGMT